MNYKACAYIRLSREDDDSRESESVKNQKSLILQYACENNIDIKEFYIDDGYSGTNYDRPGFIKMINDIENKKINMILTKDMSRLGRDYIETGNLIEKYFPMNNVRFIAITDNIDTLLDNTNNDIAPFKAIMNDMYAKDISKKIKSSLKAKMKEGKWVGSRTPFGYKVDKFNKNHLVIDKEQALIVKRIYDMFLDGLSIYKITQILTKEKVKTPASFYNFEWKKHYKINYDKWNSKTIKDILTNEIYIGNLVQNKRNKVNYKIKKVIKNKKEDYIIVNNTHDKIIDKIIFDDVQKNIKKDTVRMDKKEIHLLDGILYCYECKHRLSITSRRKKDNNCYTICNGYRENINNKICTTHSNNYDALEQTIISFLKEKYLVNIDKQFIKRNILLFIENELLEKKEKEEKEILKSIEKINNNLDTIYIDKINNNINDSQYKRIKSSFLNELKILKDKYSIIKRNNKNKLSKIKIESYIDKYLNLDIINRNLIINLIDRIEIDKDKIINIKLNFKDETTN